MLKTLIIDHFYFLFSQYGFSTINCGCEIDVVGQQSCRFVSKKFELVVTQLNENISMSIGLRDAQHGLFDIELLSYHFLHQLGFPKTDNKSLNYQLARLGTLTYLMRDQLFDEREMWYALDTLTTLRTQQSRRRWLGYVARRGRAVQAQPISDMHHIPR